MSSGPILPGQPPPCILPRKMKICRASLPFLLFLCMAMVFGTSNRVITQNQEDLEGVHAAMSKLVQTVERSQSELTGAVMHVNQQLLRTNLRKRAQLSAQLSTLVEKSEQYIASQDSIIEQLKKKLQDTAQDVPSAPHASQPRPNGGLSRWLLSLSTSAHPSKSPHTAFRTNKSNQSTLSPSVNQTWTPTHLPARRHRFEVKTSGFCTIYIQSIAACNKAGTELGLIGTGAPPSPQPSHNGTKRTNEVPSCSYLPSNISVLGSRPSLKTCMLGSFRQWRRLLHGTR